MPRPGRVDNFAVPGGPPSKMGDMSDPVRTITERVRTRVLHEGVDLGRDTGAAARFTREEVRRYSELALGGAHAELHDELATAREVEAAITGYGPLQPYFDDPGVEEIWINGPGRAAWLLFGSTVSGDTLFGVREHPEHVKPFASFALAVPSNGSTDDFGKRGVPYLTLDALRVAAKRGGISALLVS